MDKVCNNIINIAILGYGRGGRRFIDPLIFIDNINVFVIGFNKKNKSKFSAEKYGKNTYRIQCAF